MNARGEAVAEQIRSAMGSSNPYDIVSGVKEAVANEVVSLSPDAKVVSTEYFNHSYMPDLVVEWQDAGKPDHRPVFIRNSLRPSIVDDVDALATREPVVVSLASTSATPPEVAALRRRALSAHRVLVTDVVSLAEMAAPSDPDGRAGVGEPLVRLVQTNLIKGGRGLLTTNDAERLIRSATPTAEHGRISNDFLRTFQASADETFTSDSALRLYRAAELLQFGSSPEGVELGVPEFGGSLSDAELQVLLPYLLQDPTAANKLGLWTHIGSMMSLERLEDMSIPLAGIDVSPLVIPNSAKWTAKRAQLVINNEADEVGDQGEPGPTDTQDMPIWEVRNQMLTAEVGRWRVFVTTDARRLRGRDGSLTAHWDDISSLLRGFALDAVDLRGVSRSIRVSAEQSGDVSEDVALIRNTIDDSFQVTEVHVRVIGDEDPEAAMQTDFGEMTVTAAKKAPISNIVAALNLLAHRWPTDFSALTDPSH